MVGGVVAGSSKGGVAGEGAAPQSSSIRAPLGRNQALTCCRVSSQGLSEECQYLFQPQLIVQRLVGVSVLYPGYFIEQMIPARNRSVLYK